MLRKAIAQTSGATDYLGMLCYKRFKEKKKDKIRLLEDSHDKGIMSFRMVKPPLDVLVIKM